MEKHSLCFFLLDSSSLSPVPYSSVPSAYCLVPSTPCPLSLSPRLRFPVSPCRLLRAPCSMPYTSFATDNGLLTTDVPFTRCFLNLPHTGAA